MENYVLGETRVTFDKGIWENPSIEEDKWRQDLTFSRSLLGQVAGF